MLNRRGLGELILLRSPERHSGTVAVAVGVSALFMSIPAAQAHDDAATSQYGIVTTHDWFQPGSGDDASNGFKVFLSSPRHSDSGSRGECTNPGREENVNGRKFNWEAANGGYYAGSWYGKEGLANLHGRGYHVLVSKNPRDGDWIQNRDKSRSWGSDVHIVTHTNATTGCDAAGNYLLTLWNDTNDQNLAAEVGPSLNTGFGVGDGVPGPGQRGKAVDILGWTPGELLTNRPRGDVYVELQFHDNQSTQTWIHDDSKRDAACLYGWAVDKHLGYP